VADQTSHPTETSTKQDTLESLRETNDPRGWPGSDILWDRLHDVGFGKIYLRPDPAKIRPKKEVESKIKELHGGLESVKSLLISGPIGTGKTTILCYLAFHCLRLLAIPSQSLYRFFSSKEGPEGFVGFEWSLPQIAFISTGELFDLFFDRERKITEDLKKTPILFLDDFGREYQTEFPLSKFENWIEHRYANLLLTFITTNISLKDLAKRDRWARIVDRFRDEKWMQTLTIHGKSMRG